MAEEQTPDNKYLCPHGVDTRSLYPCLQCQSELSEVIPAAQQEQQIDTAITEIAEIQKFTESRAKKLRDEKGKFKAKQPLEFTRAHFVLEVVEVTVAILLAQAIWEGGVWFFK